MQPQWSTVTETPHRLHLEYVYSDREPPSHCVVRKCYLHAVKAAAYVIFYSLPTGPSSPGFIIFLATFLASSMQREPAGK